MIQASAPGKVILFGEHAVVYGRPAIAVPVVQVQATAELEAHDGELYLQAADLEHSYPLSAAADDDPLAAAVRLTLEYLKAQPPTARLTVRSSIPIASGLGSGAAVSVAIIRAVQGYLGADLSDEKISELAYQVEKLHHGTPSGIDNTVVTFRRPVYFVRGRSIETFVIREPFHLLIADTGVRTPTKVTVGDVRKHWQARPQQYEAWFDEIGEIADLARTAIEHGQVEALGPLMTRNQMLLQQLGVSSSILDELIRVALAAGAEGAKLSGGGRGGNLIALVRPTLQAAVAAALRDAGAVNVISTLVASDE